jgi:hypothetical protein
MTAYTNQLRALLSDPGSFAGTPGYQFIRDQALEATQRKNASQRNSFNAFAALQDRAAGLAATEYGSAVDRLSRLEGQDQQFELGSEANRLTGARDANALTLGTRAADTADRRVGNEYDLGVRGADNARNAADQNFGLGLYRAGNEYDLGLRGAANAERGQWYDYSLSRDRNNIAAADSENRYGVDMFNARTNRSRAQSADWLGRQELDLKRPRNVIAGSYF